MFYHDSRLQYKVRVEKPNPAFANMLQQAIGGVEGEIRVCLQYLFQAWGSRGPKKYRDMLMETGTEEISHIEVLATAVALNLEGAPVSLQEEMAKDKVIGAVMGGMNPRHVLSSGLAAMAVDSNGVPFNGSWVVGSGNLAADMYANVMAESTGRVLATRLWEATDDPGMKDMLSFLIARDTMHQNQWLAVLEELGGLKGVHPIPNSFPQSQENHEYNYAFVSTKVNDDDGSVDEMRNSRWGKGKSMDGKGEFRVDLGLPQGDLPNLAPPNPKGHAQVEQLNGQAGMINKIKSKM
ncbi:manganese catalase family protein [Pontibacter sp. H249]|uniref:manganese catalase family protein n=1 Tax=Pontibacter sp. H249 TaxID=3133420 RepID=UPI0030BE349A